MNLPQELSLLRHGQSEGNVASAASRSGDHSFYNPEFCVRSAHTWKLTPLGEMQAVAAGKWMYTNITHPELVVHSTMLRAKQTAQLAHGTPVLTYESHLVDERDLGILNTTPPFQRKGITKKFRQPSQKETGPYRWIPPGGESLEHVEYRAQALLTYLSTLGSIVNHLRIVSHAGTMGALQSLVEHLSAEEYDQLYTNEKGHSPFFNCHLLHYRGLQNGRYAERRSVCAYDPSLYDTGWQSLV